MIMPFVLHCSDEEESPPGEVGMQSKFRDLGDGDSAFLKKQSNARFADPARTQP
jgi:hypothetical protein